MLDYIDISIIFKPAQEPDEQSSNGRLRFSIPCKPSASMNFPN